MNSYIDLDKVSKFNKVVPMKVQKVVNEQDLTQKEKELPEVKMADNKLDTYKSHFITLEPHEQLLEIEKHAGDMMTLLALYPHAKDDMLRYEIVTRTGDTTLARRLSDNTKYATVKTKLKAIIGA